MTNVIGALTASCTFAVLFLLMLHAAVPGWLPLVILGGLVWMMAKGPI